MYVHFSYCDWSVKESGLIPLSLIPLVAATTAGTVEALPTACLILEVFRWGEEERLLDGVLSVDVGGVGDFVATSF